MMVWLTVPAKTVIVLDGSPVVVPDYPTYYKVKRPQNADGTFDVLVDDPNAK